jgi:hypothetical protein
LDVKNRNKLKKRESEVHGDKQKKEPFNNIECEQEKRVILSQIDLQKQSIPLFDENLVSRNNVSVFPDEVKHPRRE